MATESVTDLVRKRTQDNYRTRRLAKLVKLLDMEVAALLLLAYLNFPDEVADDLKMIEEHLEANDLSGIRRLLEWYDLRNWTAANGDDTTSVEKEKPMLTMRQQIIKAYGGREPLTRNDIPF